MLVSSCVGAGQGSSLLLSHGATHQRNQVGFKDRRNTVTCLRRRRPDRLGPPDRRAVDDQHRHRRRGGRRRSRWWRWRAPGRRSSASRSTTTPRPLRCPSSSSASPTSASTVPVIGDFHYNGHLLLTKYPACAAALAKYRINPGNVGSRHRDENFRTIVQVAIDHGKPVRIGVNWGSLDQDLLTSMMDANARSAKPARRERRLHGSDDRERAAVGRARRGDRARPRPHHHLGEDLAGAGSARLLPAARGALRLPAAPRAHRGRARHEGNRRDDGGAVARARGGNRRHDSRVAHAEPGR